MRVMTIGRTGLTARRSARNAHALLFSRDRADGGGGGADDGIDTGDDGPDTDDTDDDADDDDADDAGDDAGDDDDKPLGPKGERALEALKQERRELRRQLRELKAKDGSGDADEKITAARAEEAATWKPLLVRQAATAKLAEAGLIGSPSRLIKLLDLDDIDVDPKTGDIDGLDEQISDFRKEYTELFRKKGSSRIDATDRDGRRGDDDRQRSATERQAAILLGR